jgi:hypothetical protein
MLLRVLGKSLAIGVISGATLLVGIGDVAASDGTKSVTATRNRSGNRELRSAAGWLE